MGEYIGHASCPKCGSSDNLNVYSDGAWCASPGCGFKTRDTTQFSHTTNTSKRRKNRVFTQPTVKPITKAWRGISPETFARYGVGLDEHNNVVLPYYTDGAYTGAKVRKPAEKEFWFLGESSSVQLFGMQAANGDRRIIVTEGELDALAAYQMTGYPAVSIPFGADSAEKHIKRSLQWLERFDEVVICFDADEPGQKAQQAAMQLLKPGKAKAMVMPTGFKDANDMLKAGKSAEFKAAYFAAQSVLPSGIVSKEELINRTVGFLVDKTTRVGKPTGYHGLDELIGGWREGEVHTFVAGTGIGKSTVTRNLCYRQAKRGLKSLYIPLEDLTEVATARFAEMDMHQVLVKNTHNNDGFVSADAIRASLENLLDTIILYDQKGSMTVDSLVTAIEYVVRMHDVKFVVLDHITAMSNSVEGESERKALDICIEALKLRVAVALRCTVVVVSHISRDRNDEEDNEPTLARIKGASSIAQYSDTVFAVVRDRDSHNTTIKTLKANRLWGVYGGFDVAWNNTTQQLEEVINAYQQTEEDTPTSDPIQQAEPTEKAGTSVGGAEVSQPVRAERVETERTGPEGGRVRDNDVPVHSDIEVHARPDTTERSGSGDEGTTDGGGQEKVVTRKRATRKYHTRPVLPT